MSEVVALTAAGGSALNAAKERLAWEVTRLIHGQEEADRARDSAKRAFGGAHDATGSAVPHEDIAAAELAAGVALVELLVRAKLSPSKGEARRLIEGGGVCIGETRVDDVQRKVVAGDAVEGHVLLKAGKKRMFRFDIR